MPSSGNILVSAGSMPLAPANLAVLDASVYIKNFRLIPLTTRDAGATVIACNREHFFGLGK